MLMEAISQSPDDSYLAASGEALKVKNCSLRTNDKTSMSMQFVEARNVILYLHNLIEDDTLQGSSDSLWEIVKQNLVHNKINAQSWCNRTGPILATLLQKANYLPEAQCDVLLFYCLFLAPELGPSPDGFGNVPRWRSFMTDDGTPIEMSWEWGLEDCSPIVRLSIEPIGLAAGTPQDPLNAFAATRLVENVQHISPFTDLRLYHYFSKELLSYNSARGSNNAISATAAHQSRSFVAFDFGKTNNMLKVYFIPTFKAKETGQSTLALISEALAKLSKREALQFPAYDLLLDYLQNSPQGSQLEAEMLSVDCVSPASSRIKIYLRSCFTSFSSVRANMTLNGNLKQRGLDNGIIELEKLWKLVLLPAQDLGANEELPHKNHRTAGILYYYEFRPGQMIPTPRLYIPVRHYGQNDMTVAEGLAAYLGSRGQGEMAGQYLEAMQSV